MATRRALQALAEQPEVVLIDGNQVPPRLGCRAETIVGGDARSYSIAAASIFAKVTRDRYMARLAESFPGYGWETNQRLRQRGASFGASVPGPDAPPPHELLAAHAPVRTRVAAGGIVSAQGAAARRASGIDNGRGRDADFQRVDTTRCLRLHRRYGERIEPLQASFARANKSVTQASDIPHSLMQRIDPMRDFRDAKAMAQTLREALKTKSVSLTHSESLELVATILGFHDWNVLSATIQSEVQPAANPGSTIPATVRLAAENQLPTVPLRDIVVFPHLNVPLFAGRAKTISRG